MTHRLAIVFLFSFLLPAYAIGAPRPRARELGIPFEGAPAPLNAITDVEGVEVGTSTIIGGEGALVVGKGPARTGVTAIFPRGKANLDPVFASWASINGAGEMTGTTWLDESGLLEGPVAITNTHSVGTVRDGVISWLVKRAKAGEEISLLPVVAETWDGFLNDISGFHVKQEHVWEALDHAKSGPVAEGNVGGGTGMICFEFKCGNGTASRKVHVAGHDYIVGTLVQANFGLRNQLRLAGLPVGKYFPDDLVWSKETGSIIMIIATDAPLLPHQLKALAKRGAHALGRVGSVSGDGSGDIALAFSTANAKASGHRKPVTVEMFPNEKLDALFEAVIQSIEEAIVNSLVAADTMIGVNGHKAVALPIEPALALLRRHSLLRRK